MPRLVRFHEPTEGAFSLTLPDDWSVQAGVVRGASDPRPWYRVLSPGGGAELRGSDPRIPPSFLSPDFGMMFPMPGLVVRPYTPPEVFAESYARDFARELGASQWVRVAERDAAAVLADETRPEARASVQMLMQQGAVLAGVEFVCPDRGVQGLVDVVTLRIRGPMGLSWAPFVTALRGPTATWPQARVTLRRIAHSYVTNPAWQQGVRAMQQMQHAATMESIATGTRILQMQAQSGMEAIHAHAQRAQHSADAMGSMGAAQQASWQSQQDAQAEGHRRAVNGIREEVDLYDPAAGQVLRGAPAGYDSWWSDGAGQVVARQGHENPDAARYTEAVNLDDVDPAQRPRR